MRNLGKLLICTFMVCLFPLLGVAAAELEVPSIKVEKAPVIDGLSQDAVWNSVKPIAVSDSASGTKILLRSVYTSDQIYFLVQFPDSAENFLHKPWVWNATDKKYESGLNREDTFVFKWNMMDHDVNLSNFSDDDYRADVWYWKANRTNPAGFADDKSQILGANPIKKSTELTSVSGKARHLGRYSDAGKAPYNELKEITEYLSNIVDRYPTAIPEGSRADVHAKGNWIEGEWTIEFQRSLKTGHQDDIQFATDKKFLFGVSRYEIAGRQENSKLTAPLYGTGDVSETLWLEFIK